MEEGSRVKNGLLTMKRNTNKGEGAGYKNTVEKIQEFFTQRLGKLQEVQCLSRDVLILSKQPEPLL